MTMPLPSAVRRLSLRMQLGQLTDGASLAAFRFLFGILMFIDVCRYLGAGWVSKYYMEPSFHFTFYGFSWVSPWPGIGMYVHFFALAFLALTFSVGFYFRLSGILFTVGFSYVFLLEKAHYLNHFYVIILIAGLLTITPAHHLWSVDAHRGKVKYSDFVPIWSVWLLRTQILLIYMFAGIAKINPDWLNAEPLRHWLAGQASVPVVGKYIASESGYYVASYGGLVLDLFVAPLLLFRRTRALSLVVFALFHLSNAFLFSIGIFPFMMLAANLVFLPTDWPRRMPPWLLQFVPLENIRRRTQLSDLNQRPLALVSFVLLSVYLVLQVFIPLRHHLYPGDVAWTEEGHRFSWRMKLRGKEGRVRFYVLHPGEKKKQRVKHKEMLTKRQARKMRCQPDMILEFAQHLGSSLQKEGQEPPQIFVKADCSVNYHPRGRLIDSRINLAAEADSLFTKRWILPRPD